MNLKLVDTCELMEELASRQGVEKIRIPPDGRCEVAAERPWTNGNTTDCYEDGFTYFYDVRRDGAEVILRIID